MNDQVLIVKTDPIYPAFPYDSHDSGLLPALKSLFCLWKKDPSNPFKDWISPGGCVVIKPNWVFHYNPAGHNIDSLITHSSVIKHIIDLLAIALDGTGTIIIGDAPIQGCDFSRLTELNRIRDVVADMKNQHPKLNILIEDWRLTVFEESNPLTAKTQNGLQWSRDDFGHFVSETHQLVDLGEDSFLEEVAEYADRFRVAMYKPSLMAEHHCTGKHEYLLTKRVFEADLVINLPKMKTHAKAGLTGALKNVVGLNGHKEYLPHHIRGSYFNGGDNYCTSNIFRKWYEKLDDQLWETYRDMSPSRRTAYSLGLKVLWKASRLSGSEGISSGGWSGNDTIWRMTLDLNHILYFSKMSPQKIITIVDGVIAGEEEGPLTPTPKPIGILMGGENPAYIDAVIAKLMGYNVARLPTIYHSVYNRKSKFGGKPIDSLIATCSFDSGPAQDIPIDKLPNLRFKKPKYWSRADTLKGERLVS